MNISVRTWIHAVPSLVAAATLLMGGCAPPGEDAKEGKGKALPENAYPLKTELTNEDGKVLSVTIIGRTSTEVQFMRDGDTKPISYPIAKLSKRDRRVVGSLPEGSGPKPEAAYVTSRRKVIADNERRMKELAAEISGTSIANTTANITAKKKKIKELEVENAELQQQIKSYDGR